ncbi:Transposase IS200 like protein [Planctomycetes bacterium CA13]|uniref:Transposase IS200 like protein n=1 Tax=Novipirellula herctigrandis TaxID=2527986 RepID=A0A5C5Z9L2_9BACT|nr:Transposase IS200 like protein [Planctomycetes bacterium CA13]
MSLKPIYTPELCRAAYQLRWSLALFPGQALPPADVWIDRLNEAAKPDHIRVLEHARQTNGTELILVSTTPSVAPPDIVRVVKGRLQHLLTIDHPVRWQRNFRLTSVGDSTVNTVENYVADQLSHHPLADPHTTASLEEFQLSFDVDVTKVVNSAHGQYALALHIVLVHAERWRTAEPTFLRTTRDAILNAAHKKGHRVSRLALLPDHVHFTLAIDYLSSPETIALSYMNNVAFRHGMLRIWMDSFYAGTIGRYDMDAVRRRL